MSGRQSLTGRAGEALMRGAIVVLRAVAQHVRRREHVLVSLQAQRGLLLLGNPHVNRLARLRILEFRRRAILKSKD